MFRGINWKRQETITAWMMSLPALVSLTVFVVLPLFMGFYWSTTNKRLISPLPTQSVGLENYVNLLSVSIITIAPEVDPATNTPVRDENGNLVYPRTRTIIRGNSEFEGYQEWRSFQAFGTRYVIIAKDPVFISALLNTVIFVLVIVPVQGGLGLLLALLVNQRLRGITIYRTIYFSPVVTSMAVISIVWTFLYNPAEGLINRILEILTFGQLSNIPWLSSTNTALLAIIILSVWQSVGFQMVIYLAGLQGISSALYEAAQIDGANLWQRFRFVTFPQLRNTHIFVVISTTILAFRLFTQVDIMTQGGPENATMTIIFHAINQGFRHQRIGYGSAITVVFFLIVLIIALIQQLLLKTERAVE
jgi:multiple sugar transport system permease protein